MDSEILSWLQNWFASQCDGDWEHENTIQIETVSNPGWYVTIDLNFTELENLEIDPPVIENGESDWYFVSIRDKKFVASGDLNKLRLLLEKFKEIVIQHKQQQD